MTAAPAPQPGKSPFPGRPPIFPEKSRVSLEQFAPSPTTCGTCKLPKDVRSELEECRRVDPARFTYVVISKWLETQGHSIHPDALRRHFNRGHK